MIVAKFSDKKITAPGSTASSLLSELKLRAIIENARQISKVDPQSSITLNSKMRIIGPIDFLLLNNVSLK